MWAINRMKIDPVAPRYMAVVGETAVTLHLSNGPAEAEGVSVSRHPKNVSLGERVCSLLFVWFSLFAVPDCVSVFFLFCFVCV